MPLGQGGSRTEFALTAVGGDMHGRGVLVNGVRMGMAPDGTATEMKGVERAAGTPVSVPGRSVVLCRQARVSQMDLKSDDDGASQLAGDFPFKGQIATFTTPFTADGAVDYASVARETKAAIDAGVSGFIVPAHASEVEVLSSEEQDRLVEVVTRTVNSSSARAR